jgi:branched-chain amino acid transport system substrate-binding protein
MKRRTLIIVIVIIAAVIGVVAAVLNRPQAQEEVPDWILVGVPAPQTGMYGGFGVGGVWGMQEAVDDINALGGVYVAEYNATIPMKLVVRNTESDETKAGSIAESLILTDEVHFLAYGDQPPPMNAQIANKAQTHKIPYICTTGPAEPWLGQRATAPGNWSYTWACGLFSIGPYKPEAGYTIADTWSALLESVGNETNKIAGVFASADSDGIGWHGLFPGILEDLGCTVVAKEDAKSLLPMDTTDFSSLIDEWVDNNVTIIWGNAPAPFVKTLLEQAWATEGFAPKLISIGRAPLFYEDVSSWTGNASLGVLVEIWWDPAWGQSAGVSAPGIGNTTAQSLAARWIAEKATPVNRSIGAGYSIIQVLIDAIERAGTLDADEVCAALGDTNLMTIRHRVAFDENQFSRGPLVYGQWQWDEEEEDWVCPIVLSKHTFIPETGEVLFPIP